MKLHTLGKSVQFLPRMGWLGGENRLRLSGFLLWQAAYSEIWFTDTYWPAFRRLDLLRALREYSRRSRRFGK